MYLAGKYLALTETEAQSVQGKVAEERGRYYVVPHVRHSLHCVNYLRKVAYDKWYPTLQTENKPTVPTFLMHVGGSLLPDERRIGADAKQITASRLCARRCSAKLI